MGTGPRAFTTEHPLNARQGRAKGQGVVPNGNPKRPISKMSTRTQTSFKKRNRLELAFAASFRNYIKTRRRTGIAKIRRCVNYTLSHKRLIGTQISGEGKPKALSF